MLYFCCKIKAAEDQNGAQENGRVLEYIRLRQQDHKARRSARILQRLHTQHFGNYSVRRH